ncbi:unnamed protein product [Fraxinus pennsylvanica]|uniref:Uncharacterized protein n=1 Tax=Fraxinus pennsylvanica TaxID=56036 RepID=A0AAD2AJJ9_9LAMI|nr:unnamed protein product [Fraxinus pennsylvanica]
MSKNSYALTLSHVRQQCSIILRKNGDYWLSLSSAFFFWLLLFTLLVVVPLETTYPMITSTCTILELGTNSESKRARCILISSSVDELEYDPRREEKDFFLRQAFSRKAKDAPRQGQTVG